MKTFLSILIWTYWAVCIIGMFFVIVILYVLTMPFDRYKRIPNRAVHWLAWVMFSINPWWTFEFRGADLQKIDRPTIVVSNHQSFLDMPLLYLLPWNMKWVSKKDLFKIPIFGWIIYMTGHLSIDRRSKRAAQKLNDLMAPVKRGIPAMIFPEGTRTRDGNLRAFKNGAFKISYRYNVNVLPVVINGGFEAMPAGKWRVSARQHFTLSVLEPLDARDYQSPGQLKEVAYGAIDRELHRLQAHSCNDQ